MPPHGQQLPGLRPEDERVALVERLDHCRREVHRVAARAVGDRATQRLLDATELTIAGIVRHLSWVEDLWIQTRLLGRPLPEPWTEADNNPDASMHLGSDDTIGSLLERYAQACERSRQAIEHLELDTRAAVSSFGDGPVNLRWILAHLISETSRHLGHLDLLADAASTR